MPIDSKRASWLELFYDVAFVALVAQLTYLAAEHHQSLLDLYNIFIVGYTIFIAWWATTANRNLQPDETATDKFFVQLQMVAAFLMSITMSAVFEGDYLGFFMTFAGLRSLQAFMLLRMYYVYPKTRPVTYNILQGTIVGASFWMLTAVIPAPYHFLCAASALAVDILTPLTRGKGNTTRYLNVFHLQERLGLFLMLVIGESMIVVALSNSAKSLSVVEPLIIFSGLFMMVALWWLYFEHSDDNQGVRPGSLFIFLHSHAFLFGSIILLSVGYKLTIANPNSLQAFAFVSLGSIGIAVTLLSIRLTIHTVRTQAVLLVGGLVLVGCAVLYIGFEDFRAFEATVALTTLFGIAAIMDRFHFFSPAKKLEA
jgi:low temperature requirement protein LtrA